MTISRPWQMVVAAAEVAEGLVCLLTVTWLRPGWATSARLAALYARVGDAEDDDDDAERGE